MSIHTSIHMHTYHTVLLRRAATDGFQGFLVQARESSSTFDPASPMYGTWEAETDSLFKPLYCGRAMNNSNSSLYPVSS